MLFADNAVVEFPYAPSVDRPHRLEGKAAIGRYFRGALEIFRDLEFRGLRLHESVDAGAIIAEVHGSATISTTGRRYEQDYVMFFRVHGGKIVAYREYWNPIPALRAFEGAALPTLGAQA